MQSTESVKDWWYERRPFLELHFTPTTVTGCFTIFQIWWVRLLAQATAQFPCRPLPTLTTYNISLFFPNFTMWNFCLTLYADPKVFSPKFAVSVSLLLSVITKNCSRGCVTLWWCQWAAASFNRCHFDHAKNQHVHLKSISHDVGTAKAVVSCL